MIGPALPPRTPATPAGVVICAVGDIHGRLDLLEALTDEVRRTAEVVAEEGKQLIVVFLGDYVDRGPDSNGVLSHLIAFKHEAACQAIFLRGNHEQVMLDLADGVDATLPWLDYGGLETLRSYGLNHVPRTGVGAADELGREIIRVVPATHLRFLRETELHAKCGDYFFVHAGLRPDRLMAEQTTSDMLWFRYHADGPPIHGEFVVHGHSTNRLPIMGRWRIGIDTEAYESGALTMLRLEGTEREFLRIFARGANAIPEVGHWSSVDSSYTRPTSETAKAHTLEPAATKGFSRLRLAGLALAGGVAAVAFAGAAIFIARMAGLATPAQTPNESTGGLQIAPASQTLAPPRLAPSEKAMAPPPAPAPVALRKSIDSPAGPTLAGPSKTMPEVRDATAAPSAVETPRSEAGNLRGPRAQIGALASPDLARNAWNNLAKQFPLLVKAKTLGIEPTTARGKTLYRAYVLGFASDETARAFCREIDSADIACIARKSETGKAE